jgi:hypothetical protein
MKSSNVKRFVVCMIVLFSLLLFVSCTKYVKVTASQNFDKRKSQIAIMQFANAGYKSGYDSYISDKLTQALMQRNFIIVERQGIQNIFSELKLEQSGSLSKSDFNKIGKLSNVNIICFGSAYYQIARGAIWPYTIMVRFIDISSGNVVFMAECTNEKDWDGSYCVRKISEELSQLGK